MRYEKSQCKLRVCSYLDYRENISTSLLARSRLVVKITEFKLHGVHMGRKVFRSSKISLADRRDLGNLDNFLSHTNTAFPLRGKSFYLHFTKSTSHRKTLPGKRDNISAYE